MTDHFEAKKHAYRQTQDGIVVSFVVHPNDVSAALATAPLGTRYMVAFAEINDTEQPSPPVRAEVPVDPRGVLGDAKPQVPPVVPAKNRTPFASLPLSQQAAIRCNDTSFQVWLEAKDADEAARFVRERCGVKSRSTIREGEPSGTEWLFIEEEYGAWLTDRQFGSLAR